MHRSGPLPLIFEGPNKVLGVKTAKIGVGENLDRFSSCSV